jgi:polygalacturonase
MGVYRNCANISLRDVTIRDSACWCQYFFACDRLAVRGVKIRTYFCEDTPNWGKDGLDIIECRNVTISDCDIEAGDDCICLKSTTDAFCENITVTNCVLKTYAQALKMGTSSTGGFRNITMTNCAIYDTFSAGIDLMVVDGGLMENVLISDIVMRNVGGVISLRLGNRGKTNHPDLPKPGVGTMRGVTVRNIRATGIDSIGCAITGIPGHTLEDIVLEDITIEFAGGGTRADAERAIPELEGTYPFYKMFGMLPAYGFYVRHAEGIRMENVKVCTVRDDFRPPYVFDDVSGLELEGVTGAVHPQAGICIRLAGVRDAFVHGCVAPVSEVFLSLESGSEWVTVLNNDLSRVGQPIRRGEGVTESDLYAAFNRMPQSGEKTRTEPKPEKKDRGDRWIDF